MGYNFKISSPWYRVKADKKYPVICKDPWEYQVFKQVDRNNHGKKEKNKEKILVIFTNLNTRTPD